MTYYYYPATKEIKYEDELEDTAVEGISDAEAVGVEYFDMLVNKVGADVPGLCVKVVTRADGTLKSVKTVR